MTKPRCLIYNPYFPVLGGGERYTVALGEVIAETHEVTYAAPHGLDPARVAEVEFPPIAVQEVKERDFARMTLDFDLVVMVSLYAPPPSFAKRTLLVVQFPRARPSRNPFRRWIRRYRIRRYHPIVYSRFAQEWVRKRWSVDSEVLHPPVELADRAGTAKENLIVSVGRFVGFASDQWNSKRQDALISAFAALPEPLRDSWRLVLAGVAAPSPEVDRALAELRAQADGLNVSIEVNVSPARLDDLRDRARFYWHATGFERASDEPERAEHFGISTVEAMSHGAIPMVYADGGQLELVNDGCGRLWRSIPGLVEQATDLMAASAEELDRLGAAARAASSQFSPERFEESVRDLLQRVGAVDVARVDQQSRGRAWRSLKLWLTEVAAAAYTLVAKRYRSLRARARARA